jgi:hypothetical protein
VLSKMTCSLAGVGNKSGVSDWRERLLAEARREEGHSSVRKQQYGAAFQTEQINSSRAAKQRHRRGKLPFAIRRGRR